jgi:5'-deoxynucleotidase
MEKNSMFFAALSRMKYINRWGLMRSTRGENLCEHSYDTAVLAHALCVIKNKRFGGSADAGRAALLALYHDAPEIFTGDMPTPVKYASAELRAAYRHVEDAAAARLSDCLPEDMRSEYSCLISPGGGDAELARIVKAADKLSALIKCLEEERAGNGEFRAAARAQEESLRGMDMPEVDCFMREFLPAYGLTLDEQEG